MTLTYLSAGSVVMETHEHFFRFLLPLEKDAIGEPAAEENPVSEVISTPSPLELPRGRGVWEASAAALGGEAEAAGLGDGLGERR